MTTNDSKILRLPGSAGPVSDPHLSLDKVARQEWRRVAPVLHSLGRLKSIEQIGLELYCSAFSQYHSLRREVARYEREGRTVRGAKSALKTARRHCAECALNFGFALDREGKMNISHALPLATKHRRIKKRIERECALRKIPDWLEPPTTLSIVGRREYYRALSIPAVRRKLNETRDRATLVEYTSSFESFVSQRDTIKALARIRGNRGAEWSTEPHEKFLKYHADKCKKLATELGFFFTST
jgi:phage terminase small subunit